MVDNTIALQARPFQMPDVGQIYSNAQNIQMNRMRMAEAQETAQERNALRGLLSSGVDLSTPEGMARLRQAAPMLAPQFAQAASQQAYQAAQAGRLRAQTQADQIKTARDLLGGVTNQAQWDAWRRSTVAALPEYADAIPTQFSPQNVQRVAEGAEGLIRRASEGAAAGRPNEFERALAAAGIRPGTPEYQAAMRGRADYLSGARPETPQVLAGPDGRPMRTFPRSGTFEFMQELPGAVAPAATAPVAAAPVDLRRPQAAAPAAAPPANMMLPGAAAPTLAAGPGAAPAAPTTFEAAQAARTARAIEQAGGEAGAQETARLEARSAATQRQEAAQLDRGIAELRRISEPGGLLERSTGSGVGRLLDIAGEFVGVSSRGGQAAAALAPVADIVLKLVPRFEGPQSDRDTRSYQEAAGRLADPTIPNETRLAAAREIIRLMETRRDQFQFGGSAAPATPQGAGGRSAPAAAAAPPVPRGVNLPPAEWGRLWGAMTAEERALWQN
jgi:DNA-binding TFAR19-related protein (PDSD5 family)